MEKITLDLIPGLQNKLPECHTSQYDIGRVIRFELVKNGEPYTLSGDENITLTMKTPDGRPITADTTAAGDHVDIVTTTEMTRTPGAAYCKLQITKGEEHIKTSAFLMLIEERP